MSGALETDPWPARRTAVPRHGRRPSCGFGGQRIEIKCEGLESLGTLFILSNFHIFIRKTGNPAEPANTKEKNTNLTQYTTQKRFWVSSLLTPHFSFLCTHSCNAHKAASISPHRTRPCLRTGTRRVQGDEGRPDGRPGRLGGNGCEVTNMVTKNKRWIWNSLE